VKKVAAKELPGLEHLYEHRLRCTTIQPVYVSTAIIVGSYLFAAMHDHGVPFKTLKMMLHIDHQRIRLLK
jgi:hypothetical protein